MNSVKQVSFNVSILKHSYTIILFFIPLLFSINLIGCSDKVTLPTTTELLEFDNTGPIGPSTDIDRLVKAKIGGGPYRVIPGEALELTMPAILQAVTKEEYKEGEKYAPYMCRISDGGTITLPLVGELKVAGMTLAQIETAVIDKYFPEYAVTRPSVFAKVIEYNTAKVSISGAVNEPGVYSLRSDQMTLVSLIGEAGGIIDEGAAVIRIFHQDDVAHNNEDASIEVAKHTDKQTSELKDDNFPHPALLYPPRKEMDVQLAFKQSSASNPIGWLTIKNNERVFLAEQLDISSEIERSLLLKRLASREPRVSTFDVEQKLCTLAAMLKPGYSMQERKYRTADVNIYSSVEFNTNTLWQSSSTDKAISKELHEILSLVSGIEKEDEIEPAVKQEPEVFVLPIKGLNIPFADVVLHDGDSVIVERLEMPLFSVVGLVNKPGNFQYPPDVNYNLMQALAFAGGLDRTAEPRYATIYRLKPDGTIVHAIFQVVNVKNRAHLAYALNSQIKPGDIIAVEHTPRTRTKVFLQNIFRINIGTYLTLNDFKDF